MKNEQKSSTTFVTINECAKLTGLARCYIRSLCRDGVAPCIRIGSGNNATYKLHFEKFCALLDDLVGGAADDR